MSDPAAEVVIRRWPWVLGVVLGFALLFYLLQPILMPFVLGGLIAYLGDPLVDALERRRMNRTWATVLVFTFISLLMLLTLLFTIPLLAQQIDSLISRVPAALNWLTGTAIPGLLSMLDLSSSHLAALDWGAQLEKNWQSLGRLLANAGKQITGSGAGIVTWMANMALVPVVSFYLMRDWDILVAKALRMFPMDWQDRVSELVAEADEVVGAFLRGQFVVMCALGLIYSLGLAIVGVKLAVLLGVIAGLASLVPYLGFAVGIVASLIAAYVQFGEWAPLIGVALVFGVGQLVESMVLTPVLVGDKIGLHPVAVIFALMAGGQIGGFVGVVVALPVAAVIMVFLRHGVDYYRNSEMYSGND